jgi:hypothetical protein
MTCKPPGDLVHVKNFFKYPGRLLSGYGLIAFPRLKQGNVSTSPPLGLKVFYPNKENFFYIPGQGNSPAFNLLFHIAPFDIGNVHNPAILENIANPKGKNFRYTQAGFFAKGKKGPIPVPVKSLLHLLNFFPGKFSATLHRLISLAQLRVNCSSFNGGDCGKVKKDIYTVLWGCF